MGNPARDATAAALKSAGKCNTRGDRIPTVLFLVGPMSRISGNIDRPTNRRIVMKKRKHENTTRLTAKERTAALKEWFSENITTLPVDRFWPKVQASHEAHARETLSRAKRKAKRGK